MTKRDLKRTAYSLYYGAKVDRRKVKRIQRIITANLQKYGRLWGPANG